MKEECKENDETEREECEEEEEEGEEGGKGDNSAAKTPVSLLQVFWKEELEMFRLHLDQLNYWQELYVRRGVTPKYDLVQIEGQVHEPTFKYRGKPTEEEV